MKKARILIPIALAILTVCWASIATAGPLNLWTWRNPSPTGNQLNGVTHGFINGNNLFVAVGANNTILTSPDGASWEQQLTPPSTPDLSLSGVVCGSSQSAPLFVAVGADTASPPNNVILTSPDGDNWTEVTGLGTGGLLSVAYDGNSHFMAVGNNGVNLYSSGGMTWTPNSNIPGGQPFDGVAYGNGLFVAVGGAGSIYTTTDGTSWTSRDSSPQLTSYNLNGITYNSANGFVVAGYYDLLNSLDGVTWYAVEGDLGSAVVYGDGMFVTVSDTTYDFYTSPGVSTADDGTNTWTQYPADYSCDAIDWNGNTFVAVGSEGTIATSADGIDWTSQNSSVTGGSLYAIAYGPFADSAGKSLFVAGGAGTSQQPSAVWSVDGYNWFLDTDSSIDDNDQYYNSFITGLASGAINNSPPAFAAILNTYQGFAGYASVILCSTNLTLAGPVWVPVYTSRLNVLNAITCGQNGSGQSLFVAVGNAGTVISSINPSVASSWTPPANPPTSSPLNAVAYGAESFVAAGMYGDIFYSSDGAASIWNLSALVPPDNSITFSSVAYGNGTFVAVGSYESIEFTEVGIIYTSSSGGTFFTQEAQNFTPATTSQPVFASITFANGLFVAVTSNTGNGGGIWVSPDGVNWTQSSVAAPNSLIAVTCGNDQYIATGGGGAILGSVLPSLSTPGGSFDISSGCFSFEVSGPPGKFGVYQSNDLLSPQPWNFLQNVTFTSTLYSSNVMDCNAGNNPRGYYYLGPADP